jgi:hypothetical protein
MEYNKLQEFVSKARLDRYLVSCTNSKERAIKLYGANLLVAQAFYPIMNLLETFLRNSINDKLAVHFNDAAWIITQKNSFMSDKSLAPQFWLKKQITIAENNARGTITPGKIIAEQAFGFWTSLFEPKHYKLISGHIIHCFPNKPAPVNRIVIAGMLKDIREFRNRIYHNENICFDNITIDFTHASKIKADVYKLLEWMDTDLKDYVIQFDTIDIKIAEAHTI